jgi:hypothetical protein
MTPDATAIAASMQSVEHMSPDATWQTVEQRTRAIAEVTESLRPLMASAQQAPAFVAILMDSFDEAMRAANNNGIDVERGLLNGAEAALRFGATMDAEKVRDLDALLKPGALAPSTLRIIGELGRALTETAAAPPSTAMRYDMIRVTPSLSPPDFVRAGALANSDGWVEVDKFSLQHVRFPEVFGLGDASNLPASKTGAAIRKQAPVVVENLLALRAGQAVTARYDGYTSCPVVTGRGKLIMAEFNYAKEPVETFPVDQRAERFSMYALKAYMLPRLYWHGMLRGRA